MSRQGNTQILIFMRMPGFKVFSVSKIAKNQSEGERFLLIRKNTLLQTAFFGDFAHWVKATTAWNY